MEQQIFNLERTDRPDEIREIVSKVVRMVDIGHIYLTKGGEQHPYRYRFIIVLGGSLNNDRQEVKEIMKLFFGTYPEYAYSFFTLWKISSLSAMNNTFFVNHCTTGNLIYTSFDNDSGSFEYKNFDEIFEASGDYYKREKRRIKSFQRGAIHFINDGYFELAGFMFHQALELGYRLAENFLMGETVEGHSIRKHQRIMGRVHKGLGSIFPEERLSENHLLTLVDKAYVEGRYSQNFEIHEEQLDEINLKVDKLRKRLGEAIDAELKLCQKIIEGKGQSDMECFPKGEIPENDSQDSKEEVIDNNSQDGLLLAKLREFDKKFCGTLMPNKWEKGMYSIGVTSKGYQDTTFIISNLVRVCLMAMEYPHGPSRLFPEPGESIRGVMGLILDLLPYEEMEMLDSLKRLISLPTINAETIKEIH